MVARCQAEINGADVLLVKALAVRPNDRAVLLATIENRLDNLTILMGKDHCLAKIRAMFHLHQAPEGMTLTSSAPVSLPRGGGHGCRRWTPAKRHP
jgi:hypothetical protein